MNINLPYDYSNNVSDVNIILKNKALQTIGNISNFHNFDVTLNLTSYDEIILDVYKYLDGKKNEYWDKIIDLKIIYVEELDENFVIYVSIDESDNTIKHITARSLCEDELSKILIYNIEINTSSDILRDEYTAPTLFFNINSKISLLNRILEKAPHYSIGHVDESLQNIQRSFSFDGVSIYDALIEISEKIGCLFLFDSNQRIINVYDLKNYCNSCKKRFDEKNDTCPHCSSKNIVKGYGNDTIIDISKDNIATLISIDANEDMYKNCLRIKTDDDILDATIKNVNPNGSEYIYYFNEDVLDDMPKELVDKINSYNSLNEYYINEYTYSSSNSNLVQQYNNIITKYNDVKYKSYKYNSDGVKQLSTNSFISIGENYVGFNSLIKFIYDNIDLSLYLENNLMPYVLDEEVSINDDFAKLTEENLDSVAISELTSSTSSSSIEACIKKYIPIYLKNSYMITITTESYNFTGEGIDGWNYATWVGKITLQEYGNAETQLTTSTLQLEINDNYQLFLNQKILKNLKDQDNGVGNIYNVMSIDDIDEFASALTYYSLERLNSFKDAYQSGLDIMIEADQASPSADFYNEIYVLLYNKITKINQEIEIRISEIDIVNHMGDEINNAKNEIQNSLNFENYIGKELWKVFCAYRSEDTYTNSNYTSEGLNNKEIIDLALEVIEDANQEIKSTGNLQKTITSSLLNFINLPEFKKYKEGFDLGNWIRVEIDDKTYQLRLLSVHYSIGDDITIEPTFSQVIRSGDELNDVQNVIKSMTTLATSIGEIKNSIEQSQSNSNFINNFVKNGLDLTNNVIMSSSKNVSVLYDRNGILVRSFDDVREEYEPTQMKLINSTLAITDDNWESVRTAIGKFYYIDPETGLTKVGFGVNGEAIVGQLILGNKLGIYSSDSTMSLSFDNYGLVINATNDGSGIYKRIFDIQKDGVSQLYMDTDGNIVLANNQMIQTTEAIDRLNVQYADIEKTYIKTATILQLLAEYATVENLNATNAEINTLKANDVTINNKLTATEASITTLQADNVTINQKLTATEASITNLEADNVTINNKLTAAEGEIDTLQANDVTVNNRLTAAEGNITDLQTVNATISGTLTVVQGDITNLNSDVATINTALIGVAYADTVEATYAKITDLDALTAEVGDLKAGQITTDYLDANYATVDLMNVKAGSITTAMIGQGVVGTAQIADGSITDAKIVGLTANKITAGTLDAAEIEVINLKAANITVGTINGTQIAPGAIDVSNLSSDVQTSINTANANASQALQDALDAFNKATSASNAATAAQTTANGKNTVYYQATAPTSAKANDIWFNTSKDNQMAIYNGTTWVVEQFGSNAIDAGAITADKIASDVNTKIQEAFDNAESAVETAENASSVASTASNNASTALTKANTAITDSATAKTNATNAVSTANTAKSTADTAKSTADSALTKANAASSAASVAQTTADGKNTVFYQTSAPSTSGRKTNDIWFDTDDGNKMYYWNGSAWTAKQFGTNAIASLSITNALIADGTIQNAKIANLDAAKITTGYLAAARIKSGTITADKLVAKTITADSGVLADACIVTANIADLAVSGAKIANATIGTGKIVDLAITNAKIADGTIQNAKIADLDAGKITTGTLNANRIGANTITANKLAIADFTNYAQLNDYTYTVWGFTRTSDASGSIYTMSTLSRDKFISEYQSVNGGEYFRIKGKISTTVKGNTTNGGTDSVYRGTAIGIYCYNGSKTSAGTIYSTRVTATSTGTETSIDTTVQIPSSTRYIRIFVQTESYGNFSGTLKVRDIQVLKVMSSELIVDGAITAAKLSANSVIAGKIAANAVTTVTIAADAVNADKIAANAILAEHIKAGVITGDKLVAGAITGDKIAASAITANNIAADSVTADKINVTTLSAISANMGAITGGSLNIGSGKFVVTSAGALTSTSGIIAGWTIDSTALHKETAVTSGTASTQYQTYLNAPSSVSSTTSAILVRKRSYNGDATYGGWSNLFQVRYDGHMVTTTGNIAGWTITSTQLQSTTSVTAGTASTQYGLFLNRNTSQTGNAIQAGSRSYDGSAYGSWSWKTYLRNDGYFYTTSGKIGGFTLSSSSIYSGTKSSVTSTVDGIYLGSDGQIVIGNSTDYIKFTKNTSNEFELSISSVLELGNSLNNTIDSQVANLQNSISASATNILQTVSETYYNKSQVNDEIASKVTAQAKLTAQDFELRFTEQQKDINNVSSATESIQTILDTYFNFSSSGLEIGAQASNIKVVLTNDKLSFVDGNKEVAYISNKSFEINEGTVYESITIGNFAFVPRANGSLDFKKIK